MCGVRQESGNKPCNRRWKTPGALERRIDLTVPAEAVEKEVQTRLAKLARNVKMPGFRPGKVPMKMVAATYGAQVQAEVLNDKVGEAFNSAVNASKLRVAGAPRLEPRAVGRFARPGVFGRLSRSIPRSRVGDLSGVEVQRAVCPVGEAEVDRHARHHAQAARHLRGRNPRRGDGDVVVVDFAGTIDGTAVRRRQCARTSRSRSGRDGCCRSSRRPSCGMAAGASKVFPLTFPERLLGESTWPARQAEFTVTVKKVQQPVLPASRRGIRAVARHRRWRSRQDAGRDQGQPRARSRYEAQGAHARQRDGGAAGVDARSTCRSRWSTRTNSALPRWRART